MRNEIIVAVFPSRSALTKGLDHVMSLPDVKILRAAVVAKAQTGEIAVAGDEISADEGGIAGGTLGAALGALGLVQAGALALTGVGVVIAIGAGALVGGLLGGFTGRFAVNLLDSGAKPAQIQALGALLQSGHCAIIFEMKPDVENLPRLRQELKAYRVTAVEHWDNMLRGSLNAASAG